MTRVFCIEMGKHLKPWERDILPWTQYCKQKDGYPVYPMKFRFGLPVIYVDKFKMEDNKLEEKQNLASKTGE